MIKRKIKPDNQCLFTAIGYAMERKFDLAATLRQVCASIIMSNPVKYNTETLLKTNSEYVNYILQPYNWGSANEIDILSEYYKVCITVISIKTGEIDQFGDQYDMRIILLYNGTHYDLAVRNVSPGQ